MPDCDDDRWFDGPHSIYLSRHCRHDQNCFFFFFNDTATTEIYTLSLHDALPISRRTRSRRPRLRLVTTRQSTGRGRRDRKSTRLNSSHSQISYAVFCLKKKKKKTGDHRRELTDIHPPTLPAHEPIGTRTCQVQRP